MWLPEFPPQAQQIALERLVPIDNQLFPKCVKKVTLKQREVSRPKGVPPHYSSGRNVSYANREATTKERSMAARRRPDRGFASQKSQGTLATHVPRVGNERRAAGQSLEPDSNRTPSRDHHSLRPLSFRSTRTGRKKDRSVSSLSAAGFSILGWTRNSNARQPTSAWFWAHCGDTHATRRTWASITSQGATNRPSSVRSIRPTSSSALTSLWTFL